jgi:glycine cleavage system H protein
MSETPGTLKYTKSHEWVRRETDGTLTIGITDHAQDLMGDLVYVELPEIGRKLAAGGECAVVESVKAASDVYAPVGGEIVETNSALGQTPETINTDPYGAGWMFKIRPSNPADVDALLDAAAYDAQVASEKH